MARSRKQRVLLALLLVLVIAVLALANAQSAHLHAAAAMPALAIVAWMPLLDPQVRPLATREAPLPRRANVPRPTLFQLPPPANLQ